jgi:hypothetical protein
MSIDDRYRDKNGLISRKHGNTLVSTLRRIYEGGPSQPANLNRSNSATFSPNSTSGMTPFPRAAQDRPPQQRWKRQECRMSDRLVSSKMDLFSRRQVVRGLGAGLANVVAAPAFAQNTTQISQRTETMQDPVGKYPKPPFKRQSQPWPGLASKMDPKPDHGETSYKGSGRLAGRKALITGGDSGMGRAAAIAYAREGADVAINFYPDEEPDAQEVIKLIKDAGRNGVALPGDLRDEAFCTKLVMMRRRGWAASILS